ncbi:hypothetical protein D7V21_02000 [Acinetobacter guerrae]|uniref:Uncharacterized protein n=1 Tax=Acinetobacter guerrae TaxID=1843371 RepID=A0A3A8ENC6_9GAMM|nr:hypothetical protein [Acinetobacter guerrae]RKG35668.1 hypothetical protein D7V21_02000 [Acinetobacter guerrae]
MNKFLLFIKTMPFVFLTIVFSFLYLFSFVVQYIYINKNLKEICKIMFKYDDLYKAPLNYFDFYFLSALPLVFWRETLNIKKGTKFKKLYGKEFYFKIERHKLNKLLHQNSYFFYIQYLVFLFGILSMIFIAIACFLIKFN